MKRRAIRATKALVILIGLIWLYTKIMWPSTFTDAPEILANLYAKEFCTCRYVIGQSVERCDENHAIVLRPGRIDWDDPAKRVHVRVLWATAVAQVQSARLGCRRESPGTRSPR